MAMNSGYKTTNEHVVAWWDDKYVIPRHAFRELDEYGVNRIPAEVVNGASFGQLFGYAVYLMNELSKKSWTQNDVFMWVVFDAFDELSEPKHKVMCEVFWAQQAILNENYGMDQRGELATLAKECVKTWTLHTYTKMVEVRKALTDAEEEE